MSRIVTFDRSQANVHPPPCPFSDRTYPWSRRPAMIRRTTTGRANFDLSPGSKVGTELNSVQRPDQKMTTAIATRERLVQAAQEELIRTHGHLKMQAVAKRAQVSVGLAYHHFGSKAGLIAAVVEAFYSRLDEEVFNEACRPSESWADRERRRTAPYIA